MFENSLPTRAGAKASLSELMMENTLDPAAEPSISSIRAWRAVGARAAQVARRARRRRGRELVRVARACWHRRRRRAPERTDAVSQELDRHAFAERLRKHFAADGNARRASRCACGARHRQRSSVTRIATRLAEATTPCEIAASFPRPQPRPMLDGRRDKRQQEISMPLSVAAALDRQFDLRQLRRRTLESIRLCRCPQSR